MILDPASLPPLPVDDCTLNYGGITFKKVRLTNCLRVGDGIELNFAMAYVPEETRMTGKMMGDLLLSLQRLLTTTMDLTVDREGKAIIHIIVPPPHDIESESIHPVCAKVEYWGGGRFSIQWYVQIW